jgi:hypothetical protein
MQTNSKENGGFGRRKKTKMKKKGDESDVRGERTLFFFKNIK